MILPDVNILVYAHRVESPDHLRHKEWLEELVGSEPAYGLCDLVLSGFLRIVTHPKVFRTPTPIDQALEFAAQLRDRPNRVWVRPGSRHWGIFTRLCRETGATGNRLPDAYLAALAIESGSEWVTADRGFARYPGLRWRLPFD